MTPNFALAPRRHLVPFRRDLWPAPADNRPQGDMAIWKLPDSHPGTERDHLGKHNARHHFGFDERVETNGKQAGVRDVRCIQNLPDIDCKPVFLLAPFFR